MDTLIVGFLQAYKELDEICKQVFSSDNGISEYIDGMELKHHNHMNVPEWDKSYQRLKKMRHVRNKLVHETSSFDEGLFNEDDIAWLEEFRSNIIERTDPLALLREQKPAADKASIPPKRLSASIDPSSEKSATQSFKEQMRASQRSRTKDIIAMAFGFLALSVGIVLILFLLFFLTR